MAKGCTYLWMHQAQILHSPIQCILQTQELDICEMCLISFLPPWHVLCQRSFRRPEKWWDELQFGLAFLLPTKKTSLQLGVPWNTLSSLSSLHVCSSALKTHCCKCIIFQGVHLLTIWPWLFNGEAVWFSSGWNWTINSQEKTCCLWTFSLLLSLLILSRSKTTGIMAIWVGFQSVVIVLLCWRMALRLLDLLDFLAIFPTGSHGIALLRFETTPLFPLTPLVY